MYKKSVGFELRKLSNLMKRQVDKFFLDDDGAATGMHGIIIGYLVENQDRIVLQRDFEEEFMMRRSSASRILQLMEKSGFITRESVDGDARLKKILLTDKAMRIHERAEENLKLIEEKLIRDISESDLETFFAVVEKMKHNLL